MGQSVCEYCPLLPSKRKTGTQTESDPPGPIKSSSCSLPPPAMPPPSHSVGSAHVACQQHKHKLGLHHQAGWGWGGIALAWEQLQAASALWSIATPPPPNKAARAAQNNMGTGRCPSSRLPPQAWQGGLGTGKATALSSPQLCSWPLGQLRLGMQSHSEEVQPRDQAGGQESEGHGGTLGKSLPICAWVLVYKTESLTQSPCGSVSIPAPRPALGTGSQGLPPAPWCFTLFLPPLLRLLLLSPG